MKQYAGFIEHNDWEGEDFGYYFELTDELVPILKQIESNWVKNGDSDTCYSLDLGPYTERELDLIEHGANNGYMPRCTISGIETLKQYAQVDEYVENVKSFVYKGSFELNGQWISF